jgi:hypothetical protein
MSTIITIPDPCHESWDAMTATEKGKHCHTCATTVIDFTHWQPQDIIKELKKGKNICARLNDDQLNVPIPTTEDFVKQIAYFKMSTFKKAAAIFLYVFMLGASSCNENIKGDVVTTPIETLAQSSFMGESIAISTIDSPPPSIHHDTIKKRVYNGIRVGKVAIGKKPTTVVPVAENKNLIKDTTLFHGPKVGQVIMVTPNNKKKVKSKR